ncbi:MAG: hypothetical protein ACJAVK_000994 [Akkermansiaceae bacterium]|jgi:hypothetical protein
MSESHEPVDISGYQPLLEALVTDGVSFVLVGGHAVNVWAQVYYNRIAHAETFRPFTSKDADLIGTRDELYHIAKLLKGTLQTYRDLRTPVLGVFTTADDPPLKLELLQGLCGMGNTERIIARAKHFGTIPVIERDFINEFKLMKDLREDRLPSKGLKVAELTFTDCLPMDTLACCDHAKIKRFLSQSFGIFW